MTEPLVIPVEEVIAARDKQARYMDTLARYTRDVLDDLISRAVPLPGGDVSARRIAELAEALRPFASEASVFDHLSNDHAEMQIVAVGLTAADLRRARRALDRALATNPNQEESG